MAATYLQAQKPAAGIGRLIRDHRVRLHMSQCDLARRARLDRSFISRLEYGARSADADTLHTIADALGLGAVDRVVLLSHAGYLAFPVDELRAHMLIDYWQTTD